VPERRRPAGCEEAAEVIEIRAFLELEVKVLLGEVEVSEAMLIHEFDDAADFLEFHGAEGLGVRWAAASG
jgi:hypothetical protein